MTDTIEFDTVMGVQRIFRDVMGAFSRPFKVYNIKEHVSDNPLVQGEYEVIKGLCCVFLDNTVSFYVHNDEKLAGDIAEATYAKPAGIEEADFVVMTDTPDLNLLEKVYQGSLFNPHKGATVILDVPQITGQEKITAEGPGIDGKLPFFADKSIVACLSKAAELDMEYPKGFEIIFATRQGDMCAVPRHVRINREGV